MGDFAPDLTHLYLELRPTAEVSKINPNLVLLTVDFKAGQPTSDHRMAHFDRVFPQAGQILTKKTQVTGF